MLRRYETEILKVDLAAQRIFVHYVGWAAKWDEWIAIDSIRCVPTFGLDSLVSSTACAHSRV